MVIQFALLCDVQVQPLQLTKTELVPPPEGNDWLIGEIVGVEPVAVMVAVAELSDVFESVVQESAVTVFPIITLPMIEQLTRALTCKLAEAPTSSELIENVTEFPELVQ